jgi:hypothetical protein
VTPGSADDPEIAAQISFDHPHRQGRQPRPLRAPAVATPSIAVSNRSRVSARARSLARFS